MTFNNFPIPTKAGFEALLVEKAQDVATDATRAETARDDAQGVLPDRLRRDVSTLLADTALTYTADQPGTVSEGDIIRTRAEGAAFLVLIDDATGPAVESTEGGVKLRQVSGPMIKNMTVRIPTDYLSLQEAFDGTAGLVPNGYYITVHVESGPLTSGLTLRRRDCQHYIVTAWTTAAPCDLPLGEDLFLLDYSQGPTLAARFDMQDTGRDGIQLRNASTFNVGGEAPFGVRNGVINARRRGLSLARGSFCNAETARFNGAGSIGVSVGGGSWLNFHSGEAEDVRAVDDGFGNMGFGRGLYVSRGSFVNATSAKFNRAKGAGVYANHGTRVHMGTGVELEDCGIGILANAGARVVAYGCIVRRASNDTPVSDTSFAAGVGIMARDGGEVILTGSSLTIIEDCDGNGIRCDAGLVEISGGATVENNGGSDLVVSNGGIIRTAGCTTTNSIDTNPAVEDTNIPENGMFNIRSGNGVIYTPTADRLILRRSVVNGSGATVEIPLPDAEGIEIAITALRAADSGQALRMQVSTDDGATWVDGAADYSWVFRRFQAASAGPTEAHGQNHEDTAISITGAVPTSGNIQNATITISLSRPGQSTQAQFSWHGNMQASNNVGLLNGAGMTKSALAINRVRFFMSSGNLRTFRAALYVKRP